MLHGAALAEQERFAVVDHPAVDADPTDLAGEPSIFDLGAAVHHHLQSGVFGHLRRLVVANPELHPHHLCTDGNGLAHSLRRGLGGAEHVDDIDRLLDIGKRSVDLLSEKLFAGVSGIDRNDTVAFRHEIFHREIAWPRLRRARPYEGKGAAAPENASDIGVAIAVVVHASRRAVMLANGSGMTAVPPQRRHGAKNRYFWSSAPPGDAGAEGGVSEEGAESAGFVSAGFSSAGFSLFLAAFSLSVLGSFGFSSCSLQAALTSAMCSLRQSLTFLPAAFASLQNLALSSLQGFLAKAAVAVAGTKKAIMTNATSCFMPIDSNSSEG